MSLTDSLKDLYNSDQYPLHMPGHKRTDMGELSGAYHLDITEIEGYDNLYDAQGILREAMDFAGKMYNCPATYYLVNGATGGIITAIYAVTKQGDSILLANNCHRSVFSAAELRELKISVIDTVKVTDDIDGSIDCDELNTILWKNKEDNSLPKALVITSPNYDGIVTDVKKVADICHSYGVGLIVDEAHGAHFSLDERLPKGALSCGADIVIHSSHKTLAAMTQTALLHVRGNLVDITKLEHYWHIFQTSSPSYVLMASIDAALRELEKDGSRLWTDFLNRKKTFLEECRRLKELKILSPDDISGKGSVSDLDPCKITVLTGVRITGYTLQKILLEEYDIQLELASDGKILAIVTYADREEGFRRFADALLEIDGRISGGEISAMKSMTQAEASQVKNRDLYAPCIPAGY